jgi:hypothetical protein
MQLMVRGLFSMKAIRSFWKALGQLGKRRAAGKVALIRPKRWRHLESLWQEQASTIDFASKTAYIVIGSL